MKTSILKKVLFVIMLFVCHSSLAHDFEVNGIYYGISIFNKNTAYVTHRGTGYNDYKEYSGSVVIPVSVTYNGKSYTVASIGGYAFYGCDELTSVTIPGTVNTINQNAFNGCTGLMDIECRATTPPALGDNAFTSYTATLKVPSTSLSAYKSAEVWKYFKYFGEEGGNDDNPTDNSGLYYNIISPTEVEVIAGSVRYIGDIVIPSKTTIDGKTYTVTKIGDYAFDNCVELTSVDIPATIKIIGDNCFENCIALSSVVMPNSVLSIGIQAFSHCTGLTNVTISNHLTSIGEAVFLNCTGLTSITIPNSVTSIGTEAFSLCTGLTSLEIGKSVSSIGNSAFFGCSGLTSVVIGHSVSSIGYSAFSGCNGLTSVTSLNPTPPVCKTNVFYNVDTQNIPLTVPNESILKYREADTWKDFKSAVTIGDVVDYEGLTYEVISGNEMKVIAGESKYTGDIVIPNEIKIDEKNYIVRQVGENAFKDCSELISVTIPHSITNIGGSAFEGSTGMSAVYITNLDSWCNIDFSNMSANPLYYAKNLYLNNKKITGLDIHYYIYTIKKYAFVNCVDITSVFIANTIKSIGEDAFYGCTGLTSVYISDLATWCNIDFSNMSANPLYYAKNLYLYGGKKTNLVISDDITVIKSYTFVNCINLTSVTIGKSVRDIVNHAFNNCIGLTQVKSMSPTPPTCGNDVFANVDIKNITLSVPSESVSAYKAADTWKDFGTITEIGETPVTPTETTLEELWCHDISAHGSAVRKAVCIGDQIAVTDISFSGGSDKVLFYNAMGKMDKNYDVAKYLSDNQIGTTGEDGAFTPYTLGSGIAVDNVGNIVVNLGFPSAISSTNFVAIKPNGAMSLIVCEKPLGYTPARADFIDVIGNIFFNAYIGLAPHNLYNVVVYNIYQVSNDIDYSYLVSTGDVNFSNETKVFWANKTLSVDAENAPEFYVYCRSVGAMYYCDGNIYDGFQMLKMEGDNFQIGKATCTGATAFEVNGTTYIVMPTPDTFGMRANAFKIINVKTGEVVVTSQGAAGYTDKTNYAQDYSAWVNEDGTVNIAQLVQGVYLAMYKFTPGTTDNVSIGSNMNMSGVEDVRGNDVTEPIEYYNLNGVRVQNPGKGVYIKRQGGKVVMTVRNEE